MTPQAKVWSHEGSRFCCILNHGQNLRFHFFIKEDGIIMGTGSILACRWHWDRIRLVSLTLCAAAGRQILYSVHDVFRIRFTLITLSESIFRTHMGAGPTGPASVQVQLPFRFGIFLSRLLVLTISYLACISLPFDENRCPRRYRTVSYPINRNKNRHVIRKGTKDENIANNEN